jgi:hypothetical protein
MGADPLSGQELVERLRPVWRERERVTQADLTPEEQVHLLGMLRRLFAASEKLRAQEARALSARRSPSRTAAPRTCKVEPALAE